MPIYTDRAALLFHTTSVEAAEAIMREGFREHLTPPIRRGAWFSSAPDAGRVREGSPGQGPGPRRTRTIMVAAPAGSLSRGARGLHDTDGGGGGHVCVGIELVNSWRRVLLTEADVDALLAGDEVAIARHYAAAFGGDA